MSAFQSLRVLEIGSAFNSARVDKDDDDGTGDEEESDEE